MFGSKEYHLGCDQWHLPETILVAAWMEIAVRQQDCKMKVGFGRLACVTTFIKPSNLPMGGGSG